SVPNESSLLPCTKLAVTGASKSDDGGIADRAGTDIRRDRALPRHLDVGFDAADPIARLPVVAGLNAADEAAQLLRRTGGEEGSAERGIAEHRVGLGLAGAVTEVEPDIGAGPTPCGRDRRLIEVRLAITVWAFGVASRRFVGRRLGAELGIHENLDAAPGHQDFVLVELHRIAHVDIQ